MEGYVITMKEQEGNKVETSVLGIFEIKEDVWHLLFEYYNENKGRFERQSLNQFENSEGAWEIRQDDGLVSRYLCKYIKPYPVHA